MDSFKDLFHTVYWKVVKNMGLIGNTEYIKTKNGDYIEINRGLFHTHVTMPDGTEIELDCDFDDLVKLLEK